MQKIKPAPNSSMMDERFGVGVYKMIDMSHSIKFRRYNIVGQQI